MMNIEQMLRNIPDLSDKPAVCLETTVLTHGMPYPDNVKCALACEEAVREEGAIPYTRGILNAEIKIGLTKEEIEELGKNTTAIKVSRKDIPYCIANSLTGSTTVAGTMFLANLAKIKIFATGGIGGVHRGFNETMDVSSDLTEFSKTPVSVVCAGPKAILDIPRTLEYLETQGVPVIGYQTKKMPLFYTRTSEYDLDISADDALQVAKMIHVSDVLGLKHGSLIVNPIPEDYSLDYSWMDERIQKALKMMEKDNITGKKVTPYLLDKLVALTEGQSLKSNVALIVNNAKVAGKIAYQLHSIKK